MFDRKKEASKSVRALVQVEVLYGRRKKYIGTGVKLFKGQWDARTGVCNTLEAPALNARILTVKSRIDGCVTRLLQTGFSFEALERALSGLDDGETFLDFAEARIVGRKDIRESTRKTQMKLVTALHEFGRIVAFSDLTAANVAEWDNWLHGRNLRQSTIWTYHKMLKVYIHDAMVRGLVTSDPYLGFKVKRGESEGGRWLTEGEFGRLKAVELPTNSLCAVRDLFVLQCLTGLAYADLMAFDFSRVEEHDGVCYLPGEREKTGVEFCAVLLPEAMEIVRGYGGNLPKITNQQYNMRLKLVAEYAGINKPIASHWGRRTCGMLLLNKGVSIEAVAKVLGHTSVRTTEAAYAKLLNESVVSEVAGKLQKRRKG